VRVALLIAVCVATAAPARSDVSTDEPIGAPSRVLKPIVGFRVFGDTKVRERTLGFLAHLELGKLVSEAQLPQIKTAIISSDLFEEVDVRLVDVKGGVLLVATLDDKQSWFAAPTLYFLGERRAFGVGFIENNLAGYNQKLLLYGQLGTHESVFFATYLDPSIASSPLTWRFDLYAYRRIIDEYANPVDDPTNNTLLRTTTATYFGAGFLLGFTPRWWLVTDLRLRGGTMTFEDAHDPNDETLPLPQDDGNDVSVQGRITLDARKYRFGVRWGPYLQLWMETTIPGLDDYDYSSILFRAYYSWRLFEEHQFELRTNGHLGRNLPIHNDLVLGGATDLRGYTGDRCRGDTRAFFRAEYSAPLGKWRIFAFRAVGFYDSGFIGLYRPRRDVLDGGDRAFFYPNGNAGTHYFRQDVGGGFLLYVKNVVLPLLGIDFGYGIEAKAFQMYFQLGLVDF
jgi:outer membrane protein insertion porin family